MSRPGEVVTREELQRALWTSDTFVDFDVGLNSAIRKLREALDDSAENPRFVETLPRRGYRFIAPVNLPTEDQPVVAGDATSASGSAVRAGWIAGGVLLIATIVALGAVYERGGLARLRAGTAAPIRSLAVLPFDNLTGDAGRGLDARAILKSLESHRREQYVSSFGIALIHDALGEKEPALAAFERACEDHAVEFALMTQYPPFEAIASEPRFQAVMRRVGLAR